MLKCYIFMFLGENVCFLLIFPFSFNFKAKQNTSDEKANNFGWKLFKKTHPTRAREEKDEQLYSGQSFSWWAVSVKSQELGQLKPTACSVSLPC